MKKLLQIFIFILLSHISVHGQSMYGESADSIAANVKMNYVYSYEEALRLSKETGKPIFFNCFADWAVPCHSMNNKVFSDQNFSDWMDKNFINLFTDVTKGNGRILAKKYGIATMAHYLVLDSNGEIIHRIVAGREIHEFKKLLGRALNSKTSLRGMKKQYENGNRKINFLRDFFDVLLVAEEDELSRIVLDNAFEEMNLKDWSKKDNWKLFSSKMKSPDDTYVNYLIDNKNLFVKNIGLEEVDKTLSNLFGRTFSPFMLGSKVYDAPLMLDLFLLMQKANLPYDDNAYVYYSFAKNRGEHNIEALIDILNNQGQGWDRNILRVLDLSLASIEDLNKKEKEILTTYWQQRADSLEGISTSRHYINAIADLNTETGIVFDNISFKQALDKACKENKLVFIDCYADWCAPCKWLDRNTFKDESIGEYFKEMFISLKMNMEVDEGIELREKYEVMAFPTMLILDSDGNEISRILGALDVETLMSKIREVFLELEKDKNQI